MSVLRLLQTERNRLVIEHAPVPFLLLCDVCPELMVGVRPARGTRGRATVPYSFWTFQNEGGECGRSVEGQLGDVMVGGRMVGP